MKGKKILSDLMFYVFVVVILLVVILFKTNGTDQTSDTGVIGIHIKGAVNAPGYYELEDGSRFKDAVMAAGGETKDADLDKINLALILINGEELTVPSKQDGLSSFSGKININTADLYQLCKLDGIGNTIAKNIISYRTENGPFKSLAQLKKVDGIGAAKFDSIKDKITIK